MTRACAILTLALAAAAHGQAPAAPASPAGAAPAARAAPPVRSTRGSILRALLSTGVTVDFRDLPAREAFDRFRDMLRIDMEVRWSIGSGSPPGFDPDTPLTLRTERAPALAVLERMIAAVATEPATWQLRREGFLEVGTKARLGNAASQETRIEPIGDLIFRAPIFTNAPQFNLNQAVPVGSAGGVAGGGGGGAGGGGAGGGGAGGGGSPFGGAGESAPRAPDEERAAELIDLITSTVEPDAWLDDRVASIRYHQGTLVIRAPDYVHRQISGYPGVLSPPPRGLGGRYVDVSAPIGASVLEGFTAVPVTGAAGGSSGSGASGGASPGGPGGTGSPSP